jgi:DNA modification methylase
VIDVSTSAAYVGDCRELLRRLPDGCMQMCITSPPYWGLRDYGTARWEGGDPACDHRESKPSRTAASIAASTLGGSKATVHASCVYRGDCGRCGARRLDGQLGLEHSPLEYVANMVAVFRGVRRVLADDGTLWLNLGDSYASSAGGYDENGSVGCTSDGRISRKTQAATVAHRARKPPSGLKPKDLVGIPWMMAFALREDGWYLRSDVIWSKPNPMPESVADRPTKAHEYLFLLSKSARYFYDADAIAEVSVSVSVSDSGNGYAWSEQRSRAGRGQREGWKRADNPTRNRRTVWTVATEPYDGAHFAVMPSALVEPCVLAGSRVGDIVFDPFFGSGTVGMVAEKHGRRWIGFDLNPEYAKLQKERTAQLGMRLPVTSAPDEGR